MIMDFTFSSTRLFRVPFVPFEGNVSLSSKLIFIVHSSSNSRRLHKNIRYQRRTKLPPEFGVNQFLKKKQTVGDLPLSDLISSEKFSPAQKEEEEEEENIFESNCYSNNGSDDVWESDEIEAISSLFQRRIPQKPGNSSRERPLPLPNPHKLRPLGFPTPKRHIKLAVSYRAPISKQAYKNPKVLIGLAREIRSLNPEEDVSKVLNNWARFLRKKSLSLTIKELGHMGLPERALQTFCWIQNQPHLFPDDQVLASTVQVLARNHELKVPFNLEKFTTLASRGVLEAIIKGFIRGGSLDLAWRLLTVANDCNRMLDPSVYAKLISELGKNPDKYMLVVALLDDLGNREDFNLNQQDCTAIMKVCIRLGKFEVAESLYNWYKQSWHEPTLVMHTTLIHSRYLEKKYREALAVVWEMESLNCLLDLPAYRVVIKLFVALGDLPRAVRYLSKLKEAGFSPTYDIYRGMITIYLVSGRIAKCKDVCREAEIAGFKLDKQIIAQLLQCEREKR